MNPLNVFVRMAALSTDSTSVNINVLGLKLENKTEGEFRKM